MMIDIEQIGEIIIQNEPISNVDKDKCIVRRKINFNKEDIYVCAIGNKEHQKALENCIYYTLYARMVDADRAYKEEEDGSVYLFDRYNDRYYIQVSYVDSENDIKAIDIAEKHFRGDSSYEIEESANGIKKDYGQNELLRFAIIGTAFIAILMLLGWLFMDDLMPKEEKKVVQIPPPVVKEFTSWEKNNLKRAASIEVIEDMKKDAASIAFSKDIKNRRRIVEVTTRDFEEIPKLNPIRRANGTYYFPKGPKRGALKVKINKTYEQNFPGVGYVRKNDMTYVKSITKNFILSEENKTKGIPPLISECVGEIAHLPGTFVYKRLSNKIDVAFSDINASIIIDRILPFIKHCPAYIQSLSMLSGKANGKIELFIPDREGK